MDLAFFMAHDCDKKFCKSLAKYGESIEKMKIADVRNILENSADFGWIVGYEERFAVAFFSSIKYNTAIYKTALSQYLGQGNVNIHNIIVFSNNINCPDKVTMSLYNVDDNDKFDCGAYLKEKYNGGGHKGAAGCVLNVAQLKQMLDTKTI